MIRSNTTRVITHLFVFVVSIALVGADLFVSAQNTNSSTTSDNTSMQGNTMSGTNTNRRSSRSRRRRGRRRSSNNAGMANANAASDTMQDNTSTESSMQANDNAAASNTSMTGGGRRRRRGRRRGTNMGATTATDMGSMTTPVRTGRCDPNVQEQTDLSGTYTGTVNYAEGGLSGDTTLTITGNDFTMTSGSTTLEGRVVAVTTCNYTAVTMRLGKDATVAPGATPPPPLPTISLRAKRIGNGLSLTGVSGESKQFSFTSAGTSSSGGRRGRRGRRRASKPSAMSACGPMAHSISAQ